jgi:hypothetical protein
VDFAVGLRQVGERTQHREPVHDPVGDVAFGGRTPRAEFGGEGVTSRLGPYRVADHVPRHPEQPRQQRRRHVGEAPPRDRERLAHDLVGVLSSDAANGVRPHAHPVGAVQGSEAFLVLIHSLSWVRGIIHHEVARRPPSLHREHLASLGR